MELLEKKLELLQKFKSNEVLIKEAIDNSDYEYLLKRVEQNDFYIRQIDEIDAKLDKTIDSPLVEEVRTISGEITLLHKSNITGINELMRNFKAEAIKQKRSSNPIRAYVSNLKK